MEERKKKDDEGSFPCRVAKVPLHTKLDTKYKKMTISSYGPRLCHSRSCNNPKVVL